MVLTLIHDLIDFTKTILPGVCKQKAMLLFVCGCECVSVCVVCVYIQKPHQAKRVSPPLHVLSLSVAARSTQ